MNNDKLKKKGDSLYCNDSKMRVNLEQESNLDNSKQNVAYELLYLLACEINSITPKVSHVDIDRLYALAKAHRLTAITAMSLESAGIEIADKWGEVKAKAFYNSILFDNARAQLISFMEQNGIWYLPLKGIVLKELYPKMGMREMSDNDILYDYHFQNQIKSFMTGLGYTAKHVGRSHHDIYTKPPIYNFELHVQLISELTDQTIFKYYSDVKNRLVKDDDSKCGYHFTNEDFYIYMIVHMFKHYSNGGTGLRSLLDCYVFLHAKGDSLNRDYINRELCTLGLLEFEGSVRELAMKVLGTQMYKSPDVLDVLTETEKSLLDEFILSGTYGTKQQHFEKRFDNYTAKVGSQSKLRYLLSRLFPDAKFFEYYAPFFGRHPIFLPFGWIYRAIKALVTNRRNIIEEIKIVARKK